MRRVVALVIVLLSIACSTQVAAAQSATYHVAPTGSDGAAGSAEAPFRTLARGLAALTPGTTLVVAGGTYDERIKNPTIQRGTATEPIRVVAAPGERVVVRGLLWLSGADHWTLDGINVTWSSVNLPTEHMVKMSGGTAWRITNAELWGARSYAALLVAGSPTGWRVDRNFIHHTYATNSVNQDHLVYVSALAGNGLIEENVFSDSPNGRGVKVGPSSSSTTPIGGVTIRNNTFFNNTGPSSIQLSYGATGNIIERNVMQRPLSGRAAITAYNLNGTGNVVRDNVAWETAKVAEIEPGVTDGGGNRLADPAFADVNAGDFRIGNTDLVGYGASWGGDVAAPAELVEPATSTSTTSTPSTTSTTLAPETTTTTSTTLAPATTTTTSTTTTVKSSNGKVKPLRK